MVPLFPALTLNDSLLWSMVHIEIPTVHFLDSWRSGHKVHKVHLCLSLFHVGITIPASAGVQKHLCCCQGPIQLDLVCTPLSVPRISKCREFPLLRTHPCLLTSHSCSVCLVQPILQNRFDWCEMKREKKMHRKETYIIANKSVNISI